MLILSVFGVAVLTALLVTPVVVRMVTAYGVYGHVRPSADREGPRVPRMGGIAVVVATTAALGMAALLPGGVPASAAAPEHFFVGVLAAGWLLFAAGLLDDLYNLRPAAKLLAQCAAGIVAYGFGFRVEELSFAGATLDLGVLSLPVTLLWIVGITNAFNLIDGLDGLATGIGLVALGSTFAVAWMLGNPEVALVCAALGGALLGFLRYNFRPARIFLGDSGSLFVGFMVAVLSVHGSTKSATAVLTAAPLLLLALPILDTVLSVVRRWLRGKPVFGADEHHLHHRMLAIGLTHVRAVVALYVMAAGLAVIGVLMASGPQKTVAMTALAGAAASVALLLFAIKRLGYHEFVEAGAVVRSGMRRVRHSIRDQIHARDVAQVLARAESLVHVQAILQDNAPALGLLYATVCRESSAEGARAELPARSAARAWKLECPIPVREAEADPLILRVWTDAPDDLRLLTADRTSRVLAAAVADWLAGGLPNPHAAPAPVQHVAARRASAPA
ncbi:MraY family glycosyltransferase [Longimicrobium sp.]|uniref:MraY family glycosyltransferase n=1 Tax=Longimicrobium sp. TaxID=2029185 RepID=UPI002E324B0F|nr:MraY family glycosyltransferase [Longimicrobium sp.]HEX6041374.1 MraY family glycosyltransferase [Longimicrobium sp.]